jgi:hypothetical protein
MRTIDTEKIRTVLVVEDHFTPTRADLILKNFPLLNDELAEAVEQWLKDRTIADVTIEGLSIERVMHLRKCHFLIAVKDLARLIDPSLPAETRALLREVLGKPLILE